MNKRQIHHLLKQITRVNNWYFVVAILITLVVAVMALRQNNIVAVQLRDEVLQTDKDNGDVEKSLKDLREHIYGHMNSNLSVPSGAYPPIQLKYRYERLVAEQKAQQSSNTNLATEAQKYCEAQIPSGRSLTRIECIENYMLTRGAVDSPKIPDSLYKFDFAAPVWSPDLAGWSLVLLGVLIIVFITRLLTVAWLKHSLHS